MNDSQFSLAKLAVHGVTAEEMGELRVGGHPGGKRHPRSGDEVEAAQALVPVRFRKGEFTGDYFSAITTLGTPQDVTLQEIRIPLS